MYIKMAAWTDSLGFILCGSCNISLRSLILKKYSQQLITDELLWPSISSNSPTDYTLVPVNIKFNNKSCAAISNPRFVGEFSIQNLSRDDPMSLTSLLATTTFESLLPYKNTHSSFLILLWLLNTSNYSSI